MDFRGSQELRKGFSVGIEVSKTVDDWMPVIKKPEKILYESNFANVMIRYEMSPSDSQIDLSTDDSISAGRSYCKRLL